MYEYLILVAIFLPMIAGFVIRLINATPKVKDILNLITVCITAAITFVLVFIPPTNICHIFNFSEKLSVFFKIDGFGRILAGMVSFLWPFAYLYTMSYMHDSDKDKSFGMFYVVTYGVILGIAFAGNLITMYFFYELMTFITLPLIIQPMTKEAKRAGRFYLYISMFGSTVALIGICILLHYFNTGDFVDTFSNSQKAIYESNPKLTGVCYLLMFFGFGVKAAIFPFHLWLPKAGVAPTPTTALLHAVAVVKAGAFAIMRSIYSIFGCEVLSGTKYQIITVLFACVTILFGSSMAMKQLHIKRRLAYSTIANISYIVLAATLMSKFGLYAAMLHLIFHSLAKITLFFCTGSMMHNANVTYLDEVNGFCKKMPIACWCTLLASISLIGLPGTAGFVSKWEIAYAAVNCNTWYSIVGLCCLLISAGLTAIYMLTLVVRMFFIKPTETSLKFYDVAHDGDIKYNLPCIIFSALCIILGFLAGPFIEFIKTAIGGLGI